MTRGNVRSGVNGGRSYVCAKGSAGRELSRLQLRGHTQLALSLKNISRIARPFPRKPVKMIGWQLRSHLEVNREMKSS